MGLVLFFILALFLTVLQHGPLATLSWAPDLPLAFAAWIIASGGTRWMLVRAWGVGAIRDCLDPASLCFHAVAYVAIAAGFLPFRGVVYRGRGTAWVGLAMAASLGLRWIDRWWIGLPPFSDFLAGLVVALSTGLAAVAMGWLFTDLPAWIRPVEQGEAE